MKKRIKIDSTILCALIVFSAVLYRFSSLYPQSILIDNLLDFFGVMVIFDGVLFRMWARGHKKANSQKSESLVVSGPYLLTRNPMYLGSFLLGAGFILIVWPWWTLFVFAALFYLRFNKQVVKEEQFLSEKFGDDYQEFRANTNRIFPSWKSIKKFDYKKEVNVDETFSTKETRGLLGWPVLALVLETIQERIVFGSYDIKQTALTFATVGLIYCVVLFLAFKGR